MTWEIPLFKIYSDQEDLDAIRKIIERGTFWAEGPEIVELENKLAKYVGQKHAVVFSNGTAALHALMQAYGIGPGDEVIVPSFTFISTANAPLFTGAKPVFADIEPDFFGLDPEKVKGKITERIKAIIPIHYGGHPCKIGALKDIAEENDLLLLEDAAETLGSKFDSRMVGTFGDATMFSFCQNKVITTGEGGAIVTQDNEIADNKEGKVILKKNCRIDTHSTIMSGVTVGENSVIGAYSLVKENTPDNVVAHGVPAKVVRKLTEKEQAIAGGNHLNRKLPEARLEAIL